MQSPEQQQLFLKRSIKHESIPTGLWRPLVTSRLQSRCVSSYDQDNIYNIHIEYPFSFLPFLVLPDDDDVKKPDDDGGK